MSKESFLFDGSLCYKIKLFICMISILALTVLPNTPQRIKEIPINIDDDINHLSSLIY